MSAVLCASADVEM